MSYSARTAQGTPLPPRKSQHTHQLLSLDSRSREGIEPQLSLPSKSPAKTKRERHAAPVCYQGIIPGARIQKCPSKKLMSLERGGEHLQRSVRHGAGWL